MSQDGGLRNEIIQGLWLRRCYEHDVYCSPRVKYTNTVLYQNRSGITMLMKGGLMTLVRLH